MGIYLGGNGENGKTTLYSSNGPFVCQSLRFLLLPVATITTTKLYFIQNDPKEQIALIPSKGFALPTNL